MFTVTGQYRGDAFELTWEKGVVSGTSWAVEVFEAELPHASVKPPGGPEWNGEDCKKGAAPAYLLMKQLFENVKHTSGKLPNLPKVPKGATP